MSGPLLESTIQTYVGMISSNKPRQRPIYDDRDKTHPLFKKTLMAKLKDMFEWTPRTFTTKAFIKYVLAQNMPNFAAGCHADNTSQRIQRNVFACMDSSVDINFMKRNLVSQRRLDLEQAAAVVTSSIINDETIPAQRKTSLVQALISSISHSTLTDSCMWLMPEDTAEPASTKFSRFIQFSDEALCAYNEGPHRVDVSHAKDWSSLLPTLLRIRRCRPDNKSRCLFIPPWIFDAAHATPPSHHKSTYHAYKRGNEPIDMHSTTPNLITLSRHDFRALQRRLNHYHQYWKPATALRRAIRDLESSTLLNAPYLHHKILPSTNTLRVAHAFLALQRQLQRKIVSDRTGAFLAKGASSTFLQNTPWIATKFESILAVMSNSNTTNPLAEEAEKPIPITGAALPQIDHCCLLMEHYVQLFGHGDRANLTFKLGQRGGSGRGPVDEYNRLCDILAALRQKAARERGREVALGPVRKFLAKDIMHWNEGWKEDAFAGGVEPGWVKWLERRRGMGTLLSEWEIGEGVGVGGFEDYDGDDDEVGVGDGEEKADLELRFSMRTGVDFF